MLLLDCPVNIRITSDKHTWQGNVHTMELDLSFEQLMDEKDIEEEGDDG